MQLRALHIISFLLTFLLPIATLAQTPDPKLDLPKATKTPIGIELGDWEELYKKSLALHSQEKLTEALAQATKTLQIAKDKKGESSYEYAKTQNLLGQIYESLADYPKALETFNHSLKYCRKLNESDANKLLLAEVLINLSSLSGFLRKNHRESIKQLNEAYTIIQDIHGKDSKELIDPICSLISIKTYLDFKLVSAQQEQKYTSLIELHTKPLSIARLSYHSVMNGFYSRKGNYLKALAHSKQCLRNRKHFESRIDDSISISQTSINLGVKFSRLELFPQAEEAILFGLKLRKQYVKRRTAPNYKITEQDKSYDKFFGSPEYTLIYNYKQLGIHYSNSGEYVKAEKTFMKLMKVAERILGSEHAQTSDERSNLAMWVYGNSGQIDKARKTLQDCIALKIKQNGKDHHSVALALTNLAICLRRLGNHDEAKTNLMQAMKIWQEKKQTKTNTYADCLTSLGLIHQAKGHYKFALEAHSKAREIRVKVFGENHIYTATDSKNMADCHASLGNFQEAETLMRVVIQKSEESYGKAHSRNSKLLNALGLILFKQGKISECEPYFLQALALNSDCYGSLHSKSARNLSQLARVNNARGNINEADLYILRCLAIHAEKLGLVDPETMDEFGGFVFSYNAQGQLHSLEARIDPRPALGITPDSKGNVRLRYDKKGRLRGLDSDLRKIIAEREKALGPRHPDVASALCNLGCLQLMRGKGELAEALFRRGLIIRLNSFGKENPIIADTQNLLAQALILQTRETQALPLLQQALIINGKSYGEDSRRCALALENLAACYKRLGNESKARKLYTRAKTIIKKLAATQ